MVGGRRYVTLAPQFGFWMGPLVLAEHSHRAGPTAKAKRKSRILDFPEADPDRMEMRRSPVASLKERPESCIRFGLPTTFPEGDVPVTPKSVRSLAMANSWSFSIHSADEKRRKTKIG